MTKEENKIYHAKYYLSHKTEMNEYQKKYGKEYRGIHIDEKREYDKIRVDSIRINKRAYFKTPLGKAAKAKQNAKRHRQLGFTPLNNWFEGSEAHHVNKEDVVYIPKYLHRNIKHSLLQNINMEIINARALEFLNLEAPISGLGVHGN